MTGRVRGSQFCWSLALIALDSVRLKNPGISNDGDWGGCFMEQDNINADEKRLFQVLVVDDDPSMRLLMSKQLEQFGIKVDCAANGLEAVRHVENSQYVLIFMDIQMPHMNGLEAAEAIRIHEKSNGYPSVPIIATTAGGATMEQCLEVGMTGYIQKPIDSQKLEKILSQIL